MDVLLALGIRQRAKAHRESITILPEVLPSVLDADTDERTPAVVEVLLGVGEEAGMPKS